MVRQKMGEAKCHAPGPAALSNSIQNLWGDDVIRQGHAGSPGSGGASPYPELRPTCHATLRRRVSLTLPNSYSRSRVFHNSLTVFIWQGLAPPQAVSLRIFQVSPSRTKTHEQHPSPLDGWM
jgi:hypothetical protein